MTPDENIVQSVFFDGALQCFFNRIVRIRHLFSADYENLAAILSQEGVLICIQVRSTSNAAMRLLLKIAPSPPNRYTDLTLNTLKL